MKYKLAIFDFDGTLFNTHEAIIHCIQKTFEKFEKAIPHQRVIYDKTITKGLGLEETFRHLNINLNDNLQNIQKWIDTYRAFYKQDGNDKTKPFEYVKDSLEHIYKQDISIVIVSNKATDIINALLLKHGLKELITLVVGEVKGMKKKPDPMIFNEIIKPRFTDVKPIEIIVVGDTIADLLFAKNIGTHVCWAKYGYGDEQCDSYDSTYVIDSLFEVRNIFKKE